MNLFNTFYYSVYKNTYRPDIIITIIIISWWSSCRSLGIESSCCSWRTWILCIGIISQYGLFTRVSRVSLTRPAAERRQPTSPTPRRSSRLRTSACCWRRTIRLHSTATATLMTLGMCGNRISVRFRFIKTRTEPNRSQKVKSEISVSAVFLKTEFVSYI